MRVFRDKSYKYLVLAMYQNGFKSLILNYLACFSYDELGTIITFTYKIRIGEVASQRLLRSV